MHGFEFFGGGFGPQVGLFGTMGAAFLLFLCWSIFWKGLALWHSARRGEQWWFLALLIINTAGILEIVYLFGFAKLKFDQLFSDFVAKGTEKKSEQPPRPQP